MDIFLCPAGSITLRINLNVVPNKVLKLEKLKTGQYKSNLYPSIEIPNYLPLVCYFPLWNELELTYKLEKFIYIAYTPTGYPSCSSGLIRHYNETMKCARCWTDRWKDGQM